MEKINSWKIGTSERKENDKRVIKIQEREKEKEFFRGCR